MSQRIPRVPSYRHHKPSGQAVVTIRGADYYLGPWNSPESREKYKRLIAEFLVNGSPAVQRGEPVSVAELAERYLVHARSYYHSRSQIDRVERSANAAVDLYGATLARDFGPLALQAVRKVMIDSGTLNRRVINQRIDCIRLMFRWAVAQEMLPASVPDALYQVERLKCLRQKGLREPGKILPVAIEHVEAAMKHAFSQVAAMIRLQLLTGMRPGEVVGLTQAELNRNGKIMISDTETLSLAGVWVYEPAEWKMAYTGERRIILFGPLAQRVLEPFLDRSLESPLFSPIEAAAERSLRRRQDRKTPRFASHMRRNEEIRAAAPARPPREAYTVASYRRAIFYACAKAGVPAWHPHQLRHNATDSLVKQFGWDIARIVLGHSSINTTRIYATDDLRQAAEAMRKAG